jgi:signal transduction histidine kinase
VDADGSRAGIIAHGVDVTDHVHARGEIERLLRESEAARAEAEEANRAKSQFLANMSHELRTPINAIIGYTELLKLELAGPVTPAQRGHLARVETSSAHLLGLVDDILDLARIEAGGMPVARRPHPVHEAASAALAMIAPQAAARGLTVPERAEGPADAAYLGDADRVRQILVNLLSNAVKFTPAGGHVALRHRVADAAPLATAAEGEGSWLAVEVEDDGIGIAAHHLSGIFDPFVQVDGTSTRKEGGTGLGLTISRKLARLMGGDLTVRSSPGAGSCFTLWLPAVRPALSGRETAAGVEPHRDA